jgi:exosortase/archaeosortase family protein
MNNPKEAFRFLNRIVIMFVAWYLLEEFIFPTLLIKPWEYLNQVVFIALISPVLWILHAMGYETFLNGNISGIVGSSGVKIHNSCLGISFFAAFSMLPLAYPAPARLKLWFIPMGIVLIHLMNVARITALIIVMFNTQKKITFDYHGNFNLIVYTLTFLLWVWFIKLARNSRTELDPAVQ